MCAGTHPWETHITGTPALPMPLVEIKQKLNKSQA